MKKIIGILGLAGSGKSTIANILVDDYGFKQESFAKPLKDSVSTIFSWDRELLEGSTPHSRQWRETIDEYWSNELNKEITPRKVLQEIGTEVFRNNFHQDIWIKSLKKRILDSNDNIVITDCRFINELQAIEEVGGKLYRVIRGDLPEWYDIAKNINDESIKDMEKYNVHYSEWASVSYNTEIIYNNSNLKTLKEIIKTII
jgi:hypothetical protein